MILCWVHLMKSAKRLVQHQSANGTLNQHSLGLEPHTLWHDNRVCLFLIISISNLIIVENVGSALFSSGTSPVRALTFTIYFLSVPCTLYCISPHTLSIIPLLRRRDLSSYFGKKKRLNPPCIHTSISHTSSKRLKLKPYMYYVKFAYNSIFTLPYWTPNCVHGV